MDMSRSATVPWMFVPSGVEPEKEGANVMAKFGTNVKVLFGTTDWYNSEVTVTTVLPSS